MQHPLEWIPAPYRKHLFFAFLFLTLCLFAVLRVLDQPLRNPVAPKGIVSFELAGTPQKALAIISSWEGTSSPDHDILRSRGSLFAAFGLGIDYLFIPVYALALAFGTLLLGGKQTAWMRSLGAAAGYGTFAAALFDAVENYALWQILLGAYDSTYPAIAAVSAVIKFGLIDFRLLYCVAASILPSAGSRIS